MDPPYPNRPVSLSQILRTKTNPIPLIVENPFKGISSQLVKRPERMVEVKPETIQKVLDSCPTTRWKAIVVLCRYAGLRCPSEVFALRRLRFSFVPVSR